MKSLFGHLFLIIAFGVLLGCDARVETPAPVEKKETTIVNPPAEKKETNTTIVNPPAEKK